MFFEFGGGGVTLSFL